MYLKYTPATSSDAGFELLLHSFNAFLHKMKQICLTKIANFVDDFCFVAVP